MSHHTLEEACYEASKYLQEANVLDRERPDTLVWLTICAVELGHVQVAKQGFRQLMQFDDRLEQSTALELAELLLRFSNEQKASEWGGERGRLVQDGRYAKEAGMIAKSVLGRAEVGQARHILAWSLALDGDSVGLRMVCFFRSHIGFQRTLFGGVFFKEGSKLGQPRRACGGCRRVLCCPALAGGPGSSLPGSGG